MQDCTPVDNITFNVDTLFPSNKSYYAYRCACTPAPPFSGFCACFLQQGAPK